MGLSADEIAAQIADSHPRTYQAPVTAVVKLPLTGVNPFAYQYLIPCQIEGQSETYNCRYSPTVNATELRSGTAWWAEINEQGEYELTRVKASETGNSYGGIIPPPNMAFQQHDHTDEEGGGNLGEDTVDTTQIVDNAVTLAKLQKATALGQVIAAPTSGTFPVDHVSRNLVNADLPIVDTSHGGTGADLDNGTIPYDGAVKKVGNVMRIIRYIESTSAPTVNDDTGDGFEVFSLYRHLNGATDDVYVCLDATAGAAIWRLLALQNRDAVFSALEVLGSGYRHYLATNWLIESFSNSSAGAVNFIHRARGTRVSPAALQSGDRISVYSAGGYDGSSMVDSGYLIFGATEDFAAGECGTKFEIHTTPTNEGAPIKRLTVDQDGKVITHRRTDAVVGGIIFVQTASVTHANSLTETNLLSGASALGSNTLTVGRVLRFRGGGAISFEDVNSSGTFRFKLGSTTIATVAFAVTDNSGGPRGFKIEIDIITRTVGSGGTLMPHTLFTFDQTAQVIADVPFVSAPTSTVTYNTTGSDTPALTLDWDQAVPGDTATLTWATLELLN